MASLLVVGMCLMCRSFTTLGDRLVEMHAMHATHAMQAMHAMHAMHALHAMHVMHAMHATEKNRKKVMTFSEKGA